MESIAQAFDASHIVQYLIIAVVVYFSAGKGSGK